MKNLYEKGYILEVDVECPKNLNDLHSDLPLLPERMKINKCSKLVCNLYDKNNYVVHIRSLKQALDHGLILKKVHRVIQFNQEAWIKEYIDMNTELRKQTKNDFEKYFFKLMNNSVFGKTMENVRKHRDIKLVTTDKRRNQLVSEPNYHTAKYFSEHILATEMKKIKVKMNKPVHLGLSILEISKILMYGFWYDCIKPKYQSNANGTDSFISSLQSCNNDYQQDSRTLYTFVPNKPLGSLLEISPTNHVFLKIFNSEFQEISIWFTDQNSKPLEVEGKINLTIITK